MKRQKWVGGGGVTDTKEVSQKRWERLLLTMSWILTEVISWDSMKYFPNFSEFMRNILNKSRARNNCNGGTLWGFGTMYNSANQDNFHQEIEPIHQQNTWQSKTSTYCGNLRRNSGKCMPQTWIQHFCLRKYIVWFGWNSLASRNILNELKTKLNSFE